MKRFHSIFAGLVLAILSTPAWAIQIPVSADTSGSTVKNTITKTAGKVANLPVSAKSTGLLFFDLSNSGIDSSAVTGARLIIYLSKVTKPGNLTVAFPTTAFQETFTTATIPLPTLGGVGSTIPITAANNKSYLVISGFHPAVQTWLTTPANNLGIALSGDAALNVLLTSKEGSVGASAVLEIDVNPTGALSTTTVTTTGAIASGGTLSVAGNTTFNNNVFIQGNKSLSIGGTGGLSVGGFIDSAAGFRSGTNVAAQGNVTADQSITAAQNITATNGNITASNGNLITFGRLGIGTSTPNKFLTIESTNSPQIEVRNTSSGGFAGINTINAVSAYFMGTRTGGGWEVTDITGGANFKRISISVLTGNVGIGGVAEQLAPLQVAGNIICTEVFETSDVRFKKDIEAVTSGLDTVRQLRPVSYDWRRDEFPDQKFDGGRQLGFIAQELREVLPDLVSEGGGYLHVQYTGVIPVLTRAIQELAEAKDTEIAALQARLTRLEAALGERPGQATTAALELK